MRRFTNLFILSNTVHVSGGLSFHHQELKTVNTAKDVCQRATATCLLAGTRWNQFHLVPASKKVAVAVWHIPVAICTVFNSWFWTERPSETCTVVLKINKFVKLMHLVGFTVGINSTCFEQAYCSPSGGTTLYTLPTASQHKRMTYTNCCIYRVVRPDDEQ